MSIEPTLLTLFSASLSYPGDEGHLENISKCNELIQKSSKKAAKNFTKFKENLEGYNQSELEELYTRTFDINGICSLDVGFVLFGEDYKRGALLVEISRLFREYNLDPKSELPDHLPNVLRLLAHIKDEDESEQIIEKLVIPAVDNIIAKFGKGAGRQNVFFPALESLKSLLEDSLEEYEF